MTDPVRMGLIGLGGVGEFHLRALADAEWCQLVSVAEPREDRVSSFAAEYNFTAYPSYKDMLRDSALDAVCVASPVATHEEIVLACAASGVAVLCEKPLTLSLESADRMIVACREAGVQLGYGASYRYLPAVRKARELIKDGVIGQVVALREHAVGGSGIDGFVPIGFAHYPKGGPGGSGMGLVDHGIHFIDIFEWLSGARIKSVSGRGNISGEPPATEHMIMKFDNGAVGSLFYNDCTYSTTLPTEGIFSQGEGWDLGGTSVPKGGWSPHPGSIEVFGTKGALRIFHYVNKLYLSNKDGICECNLEGLAAPGHFRAQLEDFAHAVQTGGDAPVDGEVGRRALHALLATYESAEHGFEVILDQPRES